jgi:O-antigen/teichoic acid export membrane protein
MTAAIVLTFTRQFSAGLLQLGIVFMIARALGEEGLGTYAIISLTPAIFSQALSLGLTVSITYFVSAKIFSLQEAYRITRDALLVLGAFGILCAWLVLEFFSETVFPDIDPRLMLLVIWALPFALLNMGMMAFFQALEDFKSFNKLSIIPPLLTFSIAGIAFLFGFLTLPVASAALVAGHASGCILGISLISRHTPVLGKSPRRYAYLKQALPYGFKAYLANLTAFLTYRIDLLLVNFFLGPASTGLYVAAVRMVEQLWLISQAVSTVVLPRLASMVNDEDGRRRLAPMIARYVFWVTGLSALLVAFFADFFLKLLFGAPFGAATGTLHILLPGIVVFSVARIISNALAARGKVSINLSISVGVLIGNTLLNYIFIPWYGMEGAATATFTTYTIATIALLIIGSYIMKTSILCFFYPQPDDATIIRNFFMRLKSGSNQ